MEAEDGNRFQAPGDMRTRCGNDLKEHRFRQGFYRNKLIQEEAADYRSLSLTVIGLTPTGKI